MLSENSPGLEFLKSHGFGVIGTTRKNGSSQQTPIVYQFDGKDIIINSGETTAKIRQIRRLPKASLSVVDGPDVVVVNADVELITEPALMEELRLRMPLPPAEMLARFPEWGNPIVLRMTPTSWGTVRVGGPPGT